jgi:hypothetical protein
MRKLLICCQASFLTILLAGCQTLPLTESVGTAFTFSSPDNLRIRITEFPIPKDEPGTKLVHFLIIEGMVRSALARGAIAPLWEVQTAKLQTDAGDPKAGLTEEERAGRDGQLAAPVTGANQTFRPVALDLDGDGIEVTDKAHGVAFDVDDSGYLKQTAWVQGDDALLVLDRNYNGQFDSGRWKVGTGGMVVNEWKWEMAA